MTTQPFITIAMTTYEKSFIKHKFYRMLYSLFHIIKPESSKQVLEIFDK